MARVFCLRPTFCLKYLSNMKAIVRTNNAASRIAALNKRVGPNALPATQRTTRPWNRIEVDRTDLKCMCQVFLIRLCSLLLPAFVASASFANDGQPLASWTAPLGIECFDICRSYELISRFNASHGFRVKTVASAKTANPKWRCPAS